MFLAVGLVVAPGELLLCLRRGLLMGGLAAVSAPWLFVVVVGLGWCGLLLMFLLAVCATSWLFVNCGVVCT